MMIVVLGGIVFAIVIAFIYYHHLPKPPHQIIKPLKSKHVKQIYNDEVEIIKFYSTRHKIIARPDFIYEHPDGTLAVVEYKSRKKGCDLGM